MIACTIYDSLGLQTVHRQHTFLWLVYKDIDLLFGEHHLNTQTQEEDNHQHLCEQWEACIAFVNINHESLCI